ncbi:hypothetical protein COEREDRAFT_87880 [Coemansia reversa NRRL 1564]|uniref:Uncharacterized protein n=1 Tax=Coemansia reversa (strain ATCC 12441 / NRRL 1564) TaxID=763665 RepID=A0A2G5B8X1_COERN|nr:hypothetical protein COEREDRAFT_87880 [Coemansia reversa NRRL 1564]|eukprot:PIA15473.1 hypothetical protein COEREDRAFT_87880 [Coemansia reversa NRRL 1564]
MNLNRMIDVKSTHLQNNTENPKETAEIEANASMRCAHKPILWKHLKEMVAAGELIKISKRSYKVQLQYEKHKVMAKKKYGTMFEYLKTHILVDLVAQTKVPEFDPSTPLTASDFLLVEADFPYYIEEGIEHWIIWCIKHLPVGNACPEAAVEIIKQTFGDSADWTYFVNFVQNQSVKEISHAHVFIKRSQESVTTCRRK